MRYINPKIIAELSGNHKGKISNAFKLIDAAKKANADLIKIQTYTPDTITLNSKRKEFLIKKGIWKGYSLYNLYKNSHTPFEWHKDLFLYSKKKKIEIFSSPFDSSAVELLEKLNCPIYKIASPEIIELNLIKLVSTTKKPLIISTGMATNKEIYESLNTAYKAGAKQITLLHCISGYPTPLEDINLRRINFLKSEFKVPVGLSDHTKGSLAPIIATSFGVEMIEKHLMLNNKVKGLDSEFSLTQKDFKAMVRDVRRAFLSLGKENYSITKSERITKKNRRSIFAIKDIKRGECFSDNNIKSIRPGNGLAPKFLEELKNYKAKKNIKFSEPITRSKIQKCKK